MPGKINTAYWNHAGACENGASRFRGCPLSMTVLSYPSAVCIAVARRYCTGCCASPGASGFEDTGVPEDGGQHPQSVFEPASVYGGPGEFAFYAGAHLSEESALISAPTAITVARMGRILRSGPAGIAGEFATETDTFPLPAANDPRVEIRFHSVPSNRGCAGEVKMERQIDRRYHSPLAPCPFDHVKRYR